MGLFGVFDEIFEEQIDVFAKPGVWALFGIAKEDTNERYVCLNVGKSVCVKKELEIDLERIKSFKLVKEENKQYKNQFNESMFAYPEYSTRLDFLYKEISDKYKKLRFIYVCDNSNYLIEKYFAYTFKARYWVSNGGYSSDKIIDDVEINRIRTFVKKQLHKDYSSLIDNIDELKRCLENNE